MNTNRLLVGLVIALVLAFLLSFFVYKEFQKASVVKPTATQSLVVASVPLQIGTRLDASNVHVIQWPANQQVAGMFTRVEDVTNRAIITALAENEPVLEGKLAPKESGAGLSATIPEGMRALSVAVNDVVSVAGFVVPGTTVDVLVTGRPTGASGAAGSITRTILEDVRVLASGQKIEQDREGKPQTVAVITLLVDPDDATKLTLASTQGRIQLALRNTIDTKKNDPKPVLEASIFSVEGAVTKPVRPSGTGKRSVAPVAPPPYVIEVITGNKRENKSFPNAKDH